MIWKWLVTRAEFERLEARLGAIESEITPAQSIRRLDERVATIERDVSATTMSLRADLRRCEEQIVEIALAVARGGRRIEALRRLVRSVGLRIDDLASETARSDYVKVAEVKASLAILEHRMERDAEQASRSATGLLERIEALRRNAPPGGDRFAD